MTNWQLWKQGIRWTISTDRMAGSGVDPSRLSTFLKLSADKLLVFKWSQAQVYFFFNSYEICCVYLRQNDNFEFQLTADEKIQAAIASRKDSCFWLLATATRWSRSTSNFYALIGQKLIGEFKLVYFDSWSWHSFVSSCDVFNCLFPLDVQNEIQLLWRVFWYL